MGLIRLTKANKSRDRLLIATDAICAVEECADQKNTRVMTMDGFWYEVVDGIEKIEKVLLGFEQSRLPSHLNGDAYSATLQKPNKKAYMKKHRVMSPAVDKPQERASGAVSEDSTKEAIDGED